MSAATSPGTGLAYGLRRVCAAWGMARSSFYAMTSGQHAELTTATYAPVSMSEACRPSHVRCTQPLKELPDLNIALARLPRLWD